MKDLQSTGINEENSRIGHGSGCGIHNEGAMGDQWPSV